MLVGGGASDTEKFRGSGSDADSEDYDDSEDYNGSECSPLRSDGHLQPDSDEDIGLDEDGSYRVDDDANEHDVDIAIEEPSGGPEDDTDIQHLFLLI